MKADDATRVPTVGPEHAVQAVGDLAGELVHALRNPVAAFTTSLDLLLAGHLDADDVQALHRVLRNELRKMDEMLGRTRELTRLRQLERVPLDLAALVRTRIEGHAGDLTAANVRLERDVPAEPVPVRGDPALLDALIDALVQNALDAMHASGGVLGVSLAIETEGGARRAVLRIRDTGEGIPEPARANVFRLFYTTRKGAAGMGLPFARWIASGHEGQVSLTFRERGTESVFTMPLES